MRITHQLAVATGALISASLITVGVLGILRKIPLNKNICFGVIAGGGGLAGLMVLVIAIKSCSKPKPPKRDVAQEYHYALEEYRDQDDAYRNKLIDLIQKDGVNPLTRSKVDGYTILHIAVYRRDLEMIKFLKTLPHFANLKLTLSGPKKDSPLALARQHQVVVHRIQGKSRAKAQAAKEIKTIIEALI